MSSTHWHSSIRNKLTFLFFCVTAGAILILYFYVVPQLESNLTSQKIDALKRDAARYSLFFESAIARSDVSILEVKSLTNTVARSAGTDVALYGVGAEGGDQGGTARLTAHLISDSRDVGTKVRPSETLVREAAETERTNTSTSAAGRPLAQVAKPISFRETVPWVVVFSEPLGDVQDNVSLIRRQILIAGVIALIVAVLAGYFFSSVLARRVKRLERAAADVAGGNFSTPIPIDSEDELGQLARAFNAMQRQLARVDDARKEFIANASHELRTPIFSLGGFVELLQDEDLDESTRDEFLKTMREQVERLQKLTTDLLDLSRLDAGSLELELEPVPLRLLAREVANEFAAWAAQHKSEIQVQEPGDDIEATCDRNRVEQILRVLLHNAITHTEEGTTIRVGAERSTDSGREVVGLSVADDGPGISARDLPHVFERFHSGNTAQGSGLGLAIARELAERMKGSLEATSRQGETVFTLRLPLAGDWIPPSPTQQKTDAFPGTVIVNRKAT